MISCKNVAKLLMSDQLEAGGWSKRMEVRLHLVMCRFCSRLARQIDQLRSATRRLIEQEEVDSGFEDRLIRRLSGRED